MKSSALYPFQTRVSNFVYGKSRAGLFVGYGGGKTYLSLKWLEDLRASGRDVFPALVLVLKSLTSQWGEQIEQHSSFTYLMVKGTAAKRAKLLNIKADLSIINYDIFRSPVLLDHLGVVHTSYTTREDKVRHFFKCIKPVKFKSVIVDESTMLKEARTQRFKGLYSFCQNIPNRSILTGKPILEKPEEIFSQMLFLDDGATFGRSFWKFRSTYFIPGPPEAPYAWNLKFGAYEAIAQKLNRLCIRIPKKEVAAELPPKRFIRIPFTMTKSTRARYNQLKREFSMELLGGGTYETKWAIGKSQKMHQLCQGIFYTDDGGYELIHTMKLDWLKENVPLMLKECPILIWTDLVRLIPLIAATLSPIPLRTYMGAGMTEAGKEEAKTAFRGGKVDLLIISQAAGYAGLDLWRAGMAIFVSTSVRAGWRDNAEDRCNRIGSEIYDKTTYYDLVFKDSMDEVILDAIKEKLDMADEILKHVRKE